jgi:hypothetical protein
MILRVNSKYFLNQHYATDVSKGGVSLRQGLNDTDELQTQRVKKFGGGGGIQHGVLVPKQKQLTFLTRTSSSY